MTDEGIPCWMDEMAQRAGEHPFGEGEDGRTITIQLPGRPQFTHVALSGSVPATGKGKSVLAEVLAAMREKLSESRLRRGDQVTFAGSSTGSTWKVTDIDLDTCTLLRGSLTKSGVSMSRLEKAPKKPLASKPVIIGIT